jgi:hypothetical protein
MWITIGALISIALAVVITPVPKIWMARRKAAVGQRLIVVTEGAALSMFRRISAASGISFGLAALALSALSFWTIADARIAVRDIQALASEGAADEAMRRYLGERVRLASFEPELLPLFELSIHNAMPGEGWLQFPGLYRQFKTLSSASPALERKRRARAGSKRAMMSSINSGRPPNGPPWRPKKRGAYLRLRSP